MPHIIVEHTSDIDDVAGLLKDMHHNLAGQETVTLEAIKTRSILVDHVVVGDSESQSMMHVTLKLLAGRSDELLKKMTGDIRDVALKHISGETSITVEAVALHNESYQK